MNTERREVEEFLLSKVEITKWPYIKLTDLNNKIGKFPKDVLNVILKEGFIRKRPGNHGVLIEVTEKGITYLKTIRHEN